MGRQAVVKRLLPRLLPMRREPISFTSRLILFCFFLSVLEYLIFVAADLFWFMNVCFLLES